MSLSVFFLIALLPSLVPAGTPKPATPAPQTPAPWSPSCPDWLIKRCPIKASLAQSGNDFVLSNGIVARRLSLNVTSGGIATTSIVTSVEKLRNPSPEATFLANGMAVSVGVSPWLRFYGPPSVSLPLERFAYKPGGSRGSHPTPWPPLGVRVAFTHMGDCANVAAGIGTLNVTVTYELYDTVSAFGKTTSVSHNCTSPVMLTNMTVHMLDILHHDYASLSNDPTISMFNRECLEAPYSNVAYGLITPPTFGPGVPLAPNESFTSFLVLEFIHDGTDPRGTAQRGMTRHSLEFSRAARVVSPQIEQFPIMAELVCTGGNHLTKDPRQGYWCYDEEGTAGIFAAIDQAALSGVEMIIISQNMNKTWRSSIGVEFQSETNISWFKNITSYAASKQIEIGMYQLLFNARSATAFDQCAPGNARTLNSNAGYDCMDPTTMRTCTNNNQATCPGGPGCCSMCAASEFYDEMEASMLHFWDATGITAINQDGAETSNPCANESHLHHHGLSDSVWRQFLRAHDTYKAYMARGAFIQGMPGHWLEGGQSKTPGGYYEEDWSLPRWLWIHRQREYLLHDPYDRDQIMANALRWFITPFVLYHQKEPVPGAACWCRGKDGPNGNGCGCDKWHSVRGYVSAATLEPLDEHLLELDWALSTTFGTGAISSLRATRMFQGNASLGILQKWTSFVRKYRAVLINDYITLQWTNLTSWDGIFHYAPSGWYPTAPACGLAMLWNPMNVTTAARVVLPMFFAGASANATVFVREGEDGALLVVVMDGYNAAVNVSLPPMGISYLVVTCSLPPSPAPPTPTNSPAPLTVALTMTVAVIIPILVLVGCLAVYYHKKRTENVPQEPLHMSDASMNSVREVTEWGWSYSKLTNGGGIKFLKK